MLGSAPDPGQTESDEDPYTVTTRVEILELPPQLTKHEAFKPDPTQATLFPENGEHFLRRVEIIVSWEDAGQEMRVTRTTLAFDLEEASATLLPLVPQGGGEAPITVAQ